MYLSHINICICTYMYSPTGLKGMTFDHDFGYPFLFPPKKREEEKENESAKILIKSHAFQTGQVVHTYY